ncbi:Hypothetical protein D9617_13g100360 [Elsinoe fawcettii]|nr:Hypothetical protein D9617_13g100360 [Elsinoe fawcettii]
MNIQHTTFVGLTPQRETAVLGFVEAIKNQAEQKEKEKAVSSIVQGVRQGQEAAILSGYCAKKYTRDSWNAMRIGDFLIENAKLVRETHPKESVQSFLISESQAKNLSTNYRPCTANGACPDSNDRDLQNACSNTPREVWALQAYRNYVVFLQALKVDIINELNNVETRLMTVVDIFRFPKARDQGPVMGLLLGIASSFTALLPVGSDTVGIGLNLIKEGMTFAEEKKAANEEGQDEDYQLYANVSQSLADLREAFDRSLESMIERTLESAEAHPGPPDDYAKDPNMPHSILKVGNWIESPPNTKDLRWDSFLAAIWGPFINHGWKQESDVMVMGTKVSKKIGFDPCEKGRTLETPYSMCQDGVMHTLLVRATKRDMNYWVLRDFDKLGRELPAADKLGDYNIKVEDIILSSLRQQETRGFGDSQLPDSQVEEYFSTLGSPLNDKPAAGAFFNIPFCDIDHAMEITADDDTLNMMEQVNCDLEKSQISKDRCKFWFAVLCRCSMVKDFPEQLQRPYFR